MVSAVPRTALTRVDVVAAGCASAAAFLVPGLSLGVPSGYSWGAAFLLLVALCTLPRWWRLSGMGTAHAKAWVAVVVWVGLDWLLDALLSAGDWRALDKPIKYFLALPCFFFVLRFPPRPHFLWAGLAVGSVLSGAVAIVQYLIQGLPRAEGFTNAIQYGNLSLLMALMCLVGAMTWPAGPTRKRWSAALLCGVAMGLTGSLLSQSRGGWLAAVLVLPVLVGALRGRLPWRRLWGGALAVVLSLAVLSVVMGPALVQRFTLAVQEVQQYEQQGSADNSVGHRLAHWKLAWHMGWQKPLLGWTQAGYDQEKRRLVEAGEAPAVVLQYNHAHNELIDVFAKRGLLGVLSVLGLYGVGLWMFWPRRRQTAEGPAADLRLAACLLPLCYLGFGLTQAFLGHNSGTMFYLFMTLLAYAALQWPSRTDT